MGGGFSVAQCIMYRSTVLSTLLPPSTVLSTLLPPSTVFWRSEGRSFESYCKQRNLCTLLPPLQCIMYPATPQYCIMAQNGKNDHIDQKSNFRRTKFSANQGLPLPILCLAPILDHFPPTYDPFWGVCGIPIFENFQRVPPLGFLGFLSVKQGGSNIDQNGTLLSQWVVFCATTSPHRLENR
jgi:hypothetical protein